MKPYTKLLALLFLLTFAAAASESALARSGGGSGHGGGYSRGGGYSHGGGHGHAGYGHGYYGGRVGYGVALGIPLFGLGYYSAPYYSYPAYAYPAAAYSYPATVVAPAAAYIEQGYARTAPAAQQDWYYCANSNAYYPYVRECQGDWQRVPAQPQR